MITVLLLDQPSKEFEPVLEKNKSKSLLPVSLTNNILGIAFSWINSYFSLDKIFVVCSPEEREDVIKYCRGVNEENMIIEPEKINYSVSVFYAALFLGRIYPEETVFFIPVNFLFRENFKFGNFLFAADEMAEKDWIVIPSILLNRDDREIEYIDAGKQAGSVKGIDFFGVDGIVNDLETKKRKMFGKYGRMLKLIAGRHQSILQSFLIDESKDVFIRRLYEYFLKEDLQWDVLTEEYKKNSQVMSKYNYFTGEKKFLTMFIESEPYYFEGWHALLSKFASKKDGNLICGNVKVENCKSVICFNYGEDDISLIDIQNTVIIKNADGTIIKKFKPF